ncbi:unnamed protein product [Blepharisma stoltei]|uniref:Polyhydroxybutyrate depolymerase n=1 Tax=Blepharisma stoltei TaxID=1481888 RepID=A0AAU9JRI7_9CILI|nr:unnamed protein product [Blepharisma stoltei]
MVRKYFVVLGLIAVALASPFSVSGISSGGFMAAQMHVAFSADCVGAGVIAGGPFYCALGSEVTATTACMSSPYLLKPSSYVQYANEQAEKGNIDALSNLSSNTNGIWIFSGQMDTVVNQKVVKALQAFYQNWVSPSKIATVYDVYAEHSWVTNNAGNPCYYLGSPYINNCKTDAAGLILKQIYGNIAAPTTAVSSNLKSFEQSNFVDVSSAVMLNEGYVYVPTSCQSNPTSCKVHLAIHGCQQNYNTIGNKFLVESNLNGYAEANGIIVIYPQVDSNMIKNPEGCWDWWGYAGSDYALKSGVQMAALYKMTQNVQQLISSAQSVEWEL